MPVTKPISTRWNPNWLPQWTVGFYTEEIVLIRESMKLVRDNTSSPETHAAAIGILREIEEAGERRLEEKYQDQERGPTPEELRCIRDAEF